MMLRMYEDIIKQLKKKIYIKTVICVVLAAVAFAFAAVYTAEVYADTDDSGVCQIEEQSYDTPHPNQTEAENAR